MCPPPPHRGTATGIFPSLSEVESVCSSSCAVVGTFNSPVLADIFVLRFFSSLSRLCLSVEVSPTVWTTCPRVGARSYLRSILHQLSHRIISSNSSSSRRCSSGSRGISCASSKRNGCRRCARSTPTGCVSSHKTRMPGSSRVAVISDKKNRTTRYPYSRFRSARDAADRSAG